MPAAAAARVLPPIQLLSECRTDLWDVVYFKDAAADRAIVVNDLRKYLEWQLALQSKDFGQLRGLKIGCTHTDDHVFMVCVCGSSACV